MMATRGLSAQCLDDDGLEPLLAPLPGPDSAGVALRYDPQYRQIQNARQEDDASLPMGEWEAPLRQADWSEVAGLCCNVLATRSKDLQVAAWLSEAWLRLYGADGMLAGVNLLLGLIERYWDGAWPRIEDGEHEPRCSPFVWADRNLALACAQHLPLLKNEEGEPPWLYLEDWRRSAMRGAGNGQASETKEHGIDPDLVRRLAKQPLNQAYLRNQLPKLESIRLTWRKMGQALDERLGLDAPGLRTMDEQLSALIRTASNLLNDIADGGDAFEATDSALIAEAPIVDGGVQPETFADCTGRDQAYRQLGLIADYLRSIEPHSPTPYLLRKAVDWGRMSPEELMRDVMQDDGTFARYLSLLAPKQD